MGLFSRRQPELPAPVIYTELTLRGNIRCATLLSYSEVCALLDSPITVGERSAITFDNRWGRPELVFVDQLVTIEGGLEATPYGWML